MNEIKTCDVDGCEKPRAENGKRRLCSTHRGRMQTHGSFELPPRQGPSVEDRFWSKVNKDAPNGCWEWTACRMRNGYGKFGAVPGEGPILAHRYSRELHNGPIPEGLFVCHKCDNRCCVNPEHLFLGTAKDNTQDMMSKGRIARGPDKPTTKLTPASVVKARRLISAGLSQSAIGKQLGVTQSAIQLIASGKTWAWVK